MNKDKLKLGITIAGIAAASLIVAPVIFMVVKGVVGIAIAGTLGIVMVNAAPWVALKVANWRYRAIDAEKVAHVKKVEAAAAENPIETMRNLLLEKARAFGKFQATVEEAVTAREAFAKKCESFAKRYPQRAAEFNKQLVNITAMVEAKKDALQAAKRSLEDGSHKFEEMKAYWEMSQAAQAANIAAGMDTGDMYEQLKADTACDAVFESVNKAFAQLEVATALNENSALEYSPREVIEMKPTQVKVYA